MADIIVGERVVNKIKQSGKIVSVDDSCITVDFGSRRAKLKLNAFEEGFLRYENSELQRNIDEAIQMAEDEKTEKEEASRIAAERAREACIMMEAKAPAGVKFNSVSIRLDPVPASFNSVKTKDRELVEKIFAACDGDVADLYSSFDPNMEYTYFAYYMHSARSRYCTGYLTEYFGTYVLRVLSRNDVYSQGMIGGFTVTKSDTTEVLRIIFVGETLYCFSKNLSCVAENVRNSDFFNRWQASEFADHVKLDRVVKNCDVKYLNDHIEASNVFSGQYAKLLMAALHSNKAEIVFKNKRFGSVANISNIASYLEEYSSKHIDFASKYDVISTLPIIKSCGLFDVDILRNIEEIMTKRRNDESIYSTLSWIFNRFGFDESTLDKRLIAFLRRVEDFNPPLYRDYINELILHDAITVDDIFDKDYIERHNIIMQEKRVLCSRVTMEKYADRAKELSWIDREDNGYFIVVPKTVEDFKLEGANQHNCVYTNRYFQYVIDRESIIVFLRKEKNTSYVTVEYSYKSFEVLQAYAKFNRRVDKPLYDYIVSLGKKLYNEMISKE